MPIKGTVNAIAPGLLRPFKYIERGFKHDGIKRHEGILHQGNKNDGRIQPAFGDFLPYYPGPGKKLSIFPVGMDKIEYQTNGIIQEILEKAMNGLKIKKRYIK